MTSLFEGYAITTLCDDIIVTFDCCSDDNVNDRHALQAMAPVAATLLMHMTTEVSIVPFVFLLDCFIITVGCSGSLYRVIAQIRVQIGSNHCAGCVFPVGQEFVWYCLLIILAYLILSSLLL